MRGHAKEHLGDVGRTGSEVAVKKVSEIAKVVDIQADEPWPHLGLGVTGEGRPGFSFGHGSKLNHQGTGVGRCFHLSGSEFWLPIFDSYRPIFPQVLLLLRLRTRRLCGKQQALPWAPRRVEKNTSATPIKDRSMTGATGPFAGCRRWSAAARTSWPRLASTPCWR